MDSFPNYYVNPSPLSVRERWDEIVGRDTFLTDTEAVRTALRARGLLIGERSLLNVARPRFEARAEIAATQRVAGALTRALEAVWPLLLAAHRSGGTRLPGFDDWISKVEAADPRHIDEPLGSPGTVLRMDAYGIGSSTGIIELNADVPEGAVILHGIRRIFEISETWMLIRREYPVETVPVESAQDRTLLAPWRSPGRPRIGLVGWPEGAEAVTARMLATHLNLHGYRTAVASPEDCECDGKRFLAGGEPVDIVYRLCHLPDIFARPKECQALLEAARGGVVPIVNPLAAEIFSHKYLLALLGQPPWNESIAPGDRGLIEKALPWGAVVAEGPCRTPEGETRDLTAWISSRRENLVLKGAHGQGGGDVMLGWTVDQAAWDAFLTRLLTEGGVVQSRLPAPRDTYPLIASGSPREEFFEDTIAYVFDGIPAGLGSRLSRTEITNVSRGGSLVPVYAVGE
jgi:hypothetical protein